VVTRQTRVLLADDHTIVAQGLISLLKEHFDLVGAVGDGTHLLQEAKRLRPDVIVSDISMPGMTGLEALRQLKAERVGARVIFLTMHTDPQLATEAIRAGASGFLLKHSAGEELIDAIQQVLQDRIYLTPMVTKEVISRIGERPADAAPQLTPRQIEILRLITEGRRMKEIAAMLDLSTRTVEAHKYEIMRTLDVQSTAELVRYAILHGLVSA
jgi:DNA-binding NarL/FixJ family response regulator